MIRMVEMSVLFGIKSRGSKAGTKKGRACLRVPHNRRLGSPRARGVFRPDSVSAKPPIMEHQPAFSRCRARKSGAARSDYAFAFRPWMAPAFALWATAGQPSLRDWPAQPKQAKPAKAGGPAWI